MKTEYQNDKWHIIVNLIGKYKIFIDGKKSIKWQEFLKAKWELSAFNECYYSNKASIGDCNRSGYLLSKLIVDKGLETRLAFVHVLKYFGVIEAEKLVRKWLEVIDPETSSG